jgi:hypothetical protein
MEKQSRNRKRPERERLPRLNKAEPGADMYRRVSIASCRLWPVSVQRPTRSAAALTIEKRKRRLSWLPVLRRISLDWTSGRETESGTTTARQRVRWSHSSPAAGPLRRSRSPISARYAGGNTGAAPALWCARDRRRVPATRNARQSLLVQYNT